MPAQSSEFLTIVVSAKDRAAKTTFNSLNKELKSTQVNLKGISGAYTKLKGSIFNLKTAILGAIGGIGFTTIAKGALDTAATFEQLETKLNALTKGRGKETLDELNAWALEMPINTRGAIDAFSTMMAYGLDPTLKKMESLVNVSMVFGEHAMPRIARALGQMAALGKISAEELNQLSEVGINARKYLYEAFGKSVEDLQKSSVDIKDIIEAIWKGFDADYSGAARKAQASWRGLMTTLTSYWDEFRKQVMDREVFDFLKVGLKSIVGEISTLRKEGDFSDWAAEVADRVIQSFGIIAVSIGHLKKSLGALFVVYRSVINLAGEHDKLFQEAIIKALGQEIEALVKKESEISRRVEEMRKAGEKSDNDFYDKEYTWAQRQQRETNKIIDAKKKELQQRIKTVEILEDDLLLNRQITDEILAGKDPVTEIKNLYLDWRLELQAIGKAAKEARWESERLAKFKDKTTLKGDPKQTKVSSLVLSKSIFSRAAGQIELQLVKIQGLYDQGTDSLGTYFDKRANILKQGRDEEVKYLNEVLKTQKTKDKKKAVDDKILAREQRFNVDMLKLSNERKDAEESVANARSQIDIDLAGVRLEMAEASHAELSKIIALEADLMDKKHRQEIQALVKQHAHINQIEERQRQQKVQKEEAVNRRKENADKRRQSVEMTLARGELGIAEGGGTADTERLFQLKMDILERQQKEEVAMMIANGIKQDQINRRQKQHKLEIDQAYADKEVAIQEAKNLAIGGILSNMNNAFGDMYDASGQKIKEFFQAQKAVAIAQTIISTYSSAQSSYDNMVKSIPGPVGLALGIASAAAATIAGLARVAAIRAQNYALGGEIKGYSPHKKADNIDIKATAGEFMQPVDAVKKYGIDFMESIKNLTFPKELIDNVNFNIPKFRVPRLGRARTSFGEGGSVGAGGTSNSLATSINVNVNSAGDGDSMALGREVGRAVKVEFNKNLKEQMRVGGLLYNRR